MQIPILKQDSFLIVSIQSAVADADFIEVQKNLVNMLDKHRITGVVIDVTVLDVLDSFACRILRTTSKMLELRGAKTVIVGIQPEVAFAMVQLGLTLSDVTTKQDLDEALHFLRAEKNKAKQNGR